MLLLLLRLLLLRGLRSGGCSPRRCALCFVRLPLSAVPHPPLHHLPLHPPWLLRWRRGRRRRRRRADAPRRRAMRMKSVLRCLRLHLSSSARWLFRSWWRRWRATGRCSRCLRRARRGARGMRPCTLRLRLRRLRRRVQHLRRGQLQRNALRCRHCRWMPTRRSGRHGLCTPGLWHCGCRLAPPRQAHRRWLLPSREASCCCSWCRAWSAGTCRA